MIAVGVNHPSGRNDWEAIGRAGTPFENRAAMIEFKHVSRSEGERLGVAAWSEPRPEDIEQVNAYADDLKRRYPQNS